MVVAGSMIPALATAYGKDSSSGWFFRRRNDARNCAFSCVRKFSRLLVVGVFKRGFWVSGKKNRAKEQANSILGSWRLQMNVRKFYEVLLPFVPGCDALLVQVVVPEPNQYDNPTPTCDTGKCSVEVPPFGKSPVHLGYQELGQGVLTRNYHWG